MDNERPILVTGATGYVGGRLLRVLRDRGYRVRCLARRPEYLRARVPADVEIVPGDVLDEASLSGALAGVGAAYYLVHSMGSRENFAEDDRRGATCFGRTARAAGVERIVYLGGIAPRDAELSPHLRSRCEVGEILRNLGVPTIEFRASIILGSGSLSFEMVRALVERLPVLVTPRWVDVPAQPIGIDDVLAYLVAALEIEPPENAVFEVGGADRVSYGELMREYARQRGLRRLVIRVPVLTPHLSSLWLGLVTPLYARIGRKLIDSIRHATVVEDTAALERFPIRPAGVRESIARALQNEDREFALTRWSDALSSSGACPPRFGVRYGARLIDSRTADVPVSCAAAFAVIERIGGPTGWYYADWLWQVRGGMDLIVGGVGMRRGRPDPERLRAGDTLDCWRVEAHEPGRLLRLQAEMRLPGRAWLEFEVTPRGEAGCTIRQTALFDPSGVAGRFYWYGIWPLHQLVFAGMLRNLARACAAGVGAGAA